MVGTEEKAQLERSEEINGPARVHAVHKDILGHRNTLQDTPRPLHSLQPSLSVLI